MQKFGMFVVYRSLDTALRVLDHLLKSGLSKHVMGLALAGGYQPEAVTDIAQRLSEVSEKEMPGVGKVVAGGTLTIHTENDNIVIELMARGLPENDAQQFAESLRRGDVLISVIVPEASIEKIEKILCQYDPINIEEHVNLWRMRGWRGFDPMADPYNLIELLRRRKKTAKLYEDNCAENIIHKYPARFIESDADIH